MHVRLRLSCSSGCTPRPCSCRTSNFSCALVVSSDMARSPHSGRTRKRRESRCCFGDNMLTPSSCKPRGQIVYWRPKTTLGDLIGGHHRPGAARQCWLRGGGDAQEVGIMGVKPSRVVSDRILESFVSWSCEATSVSMTKRSTAICAVKGRRWLRQRQWRRRRLWLPCARL